MSVALAGAATGGEVAEHGTAAAVAELAVGIVVGVAAGGVGGLLVNAARRRGWAADGFAGAAVLGLAVCAYASAVALHGNGFIAAFVGGLAFGTAGARAASRWCRSSRKPVPWCPAGLAGVRRGRGGTRGGEPERADGAVRDPQPYRGPDGAGGGGARRRKARPGDDRPGGLVRPSWPGTVVFALLALEELGRSTANQAIAVIAITVLLSVVVHGVTAEPLATRYARHLARQTGQRVDAEIPGIRERRLIRRTTSGAHDAGGGMNHPPKGERSLCVDNKTNSVSRTQRRRDQEARREEQYARKGLPWLI